MKQMRTYFKQPKLFKTRRGTKRTHMDHSALRHAKINCRSRWLPGLFSCGGPHGPFRDGCIDMQSSNAGAIKQFCQGPKRTQLGPAPGHCCPINSFARAQDGHTWAQLVPSSDISMRHVPM